MRYLSINCFHQSPRCILIALLAIGVSVMVVKDSRSIDIEYWKEHWNLVKWGARRQDYVLSLSYMDQVSWAATRLRSLQCWAARLKRFDRVVEPFLDGVHLGMPSTSQAVAENFKFGEIFDLQLWNVIGGERTFPPLASWEDFLATAPRKVVLVQIVYENDYHCPENTSIVKECNHTHLRSFFTEFLEPHLFSVHSEVCIDFNVRGFLNESVFTQLIFSGVLSDESISLVFDEWRAMYPFVVEKDRDIKCFLQFKDVACSPLNTQMTDLTSRSLHPATNILITAQKYISLHLTSSPSPGFVAVLVRWEKILLYHFYRSWIEERYTGNQCMKLIVKYLEEIRRTKGIANVFFSTDIGKFGSSTFHLYNATSANLQTVTRHTEELIRYMYGTSMTLERYEQTLLDVSGTTNPVLVSQVQKAVAAQAQCLLFVGSGLFHEHTLSMYKKLHKGVDCYKVVEVC